MFIWRGVGVALVRVVRRVRVRRRRFILDCWSRCSVGGLSCVIDIRSGMEMCGVLLLLMLVSICADRTSYLYPSTPSPIPTQPFIY